MYPKISTLIVGQLGEATLPSKYISLQEMAYPEPPEQFSLEPFSIMEAVAKRESVMAIILMNPTSAVLEGLCHWSHSGPTFYIGIAQEDGSVEVSNAYLPWNNNLARVFVSTPLEIYEGEAGFKAKPSNQGVNQAFLTPAILDLSKVACAWSYTNQDGGWVNPEAISTDISQWDKALDWNRAWWLQTWSYEST